MEGDMEEAFRKFVGEMRGETSVAAWVDGASWIDKPGQELGSHLSIWTFFPFLALDIWATGRLFSLRYWN
jgi:hypothetical protein